MNAYVGEGRVAIVKCSDMTSETASYFDLYFTLKIIYGHTYSYRICLHDQVGWIQLGRLVEQ